MVSTSVNSTCSTVRRRVPRSRWQASGRRRGGQVKSYSDTKQRSDDLFYEYARLLEEIRPRAFVAENVPGLVRGEAKGYFKRIHRRLREAGYRVEAKLLSAHWLGVPQSRTRLIFIGIRDDVDAAHVWPSPLPYYYSLRDALPYLDGQVSPAGGDGTAPGWSATPGWTDGERPSRTIGASPSTGNGRFPPHVAELALASNYKGVEQLPIDSPVPTMTSCGMAASQHARVSIVEAEMAIQSGLPGRSRANEQGVGPVDSKRSILVEAPRPLVADDGLIVDPETGYDIGNVSKVLRRYYPGRRLRRLTIGELRRLCGFPDDFALAGSYSQRWERLGRAVPPPMMAAVARSVQEMLDG